MKSEKKETLSYVSRLEDESQVIQQKNYRFKMIFFYEIKYCFLHFLFLKKLKNSLNVVVKSEEEAKAELNNISKQVSQVIGLVIF